MGISRQTRGQIAAALLLLIQPVAGLPGATAPARVREPAVAGLFYPRDAAALTRTIETHLAAAKPAPLPGRLKALICPHAGYAYSGPVAASGFRLLVGAPFETVVLLAPAHYAALSAGSVSDADFFRTPLGDMPVSAKARELARRAPFSANPRCFVQRPDWAAQSSREPPPRGTDRADTWEHADEVEVPFLQTTLPHAGLVPVVFGDVDPARAANALETVLDDRTVIVASSDLSHYHSYDDARVLDRQCIDAICRLEVKAMAEREACGRTPILTLMHVARRHGWKAVLLDYRNSGDMSGDKRAVVGYAAIAFYAPAPTVSADPEPLNMQEQTTVLRLAREAVQAAAAGKPVPQPKEDDLSPHLTAAAGCFITLTRRGELRGCIGNVLPQAPLHAAVVDNAVSAAVRDPRFPAVRPSEVAGLEIEASVLTLPGRVAAASPAELLRQLRPNVDGVILRIGERSAVYLPQVWRELPDKIDFLSHLAEKAGCAPGAWRENSAAVYVFQVQSFSEPNAGR